jgi:hypothetical protein
MVALRISVAAIVDERGHRRLHLAGGERDPERSALFESSFAIAVPDDDHPRALARHPHVGEKRADAGDDRGRPFRECHRFSGRRDVRAHPARLRPQRPVSCREPASKRFDRLPQVIAGNQNASWGFIRLRFDPGNRRQGEKVPHAMKPTTDEPPRLDYSRARPEAMPITNRRLLGRSDAVVCPKRRAHEVFTSVPIPGHADSLALLRRAFPESVYALERLFAAPEGQYGRRELVFDADNRERLLMGLHVLTNIRIVVPYRNERRQQRQRFIEELSIASKDDSDVPQSGSYAIPWSEAGIETGLRLMRESVERSSA